MPVAFAILDERPKGPSESYGKWQAYVPDPVNEAPWIDKRLVAGSGDAVSDRGVFLADSSWHLLTPLNGS
ncbi:MAG TPA: hypothetical protein VN624_08195 [Rhodanobacter sp.]|nr:hypothetical protein [Rhodanobacter sp.]